MIYFKEGNYIVLLKSCDGGNCWKDSMPINHVYRLREDMNTLRFRPELDMYTSHRNGWSAQPDTPFRSIDARLATSEEIEAYKKAGKPVNINTVEKTLDNYSIF